MKLIYVMLFLLIVSSIAFAENIIVSPVNDAYVIVSTNPSCPSGLFNVSNPHGNESVVYIYCQGGEIWGALKYNMSSSMNRVIAPYNIRWYEYINNFCSGGGAGSKTIRENIRRDNFTAWSESDLLGSSNFTSYSGAGFQQFASKTYTIGTTIWRENNLTVNDSLMDMMYNSPNDFQTWLVSGNTGDTCGAFGATIGINSREGGNSAYFTMDLFNVAFSSASISIPNPAQPRVIYYDFESDTGRFTNFDEADVSYDLENNVMMPLHGVSAVKVSTSVNSSNDLDAVACGGAVGYSASSVYNLNYPNGTYHTVCFNLSSEHTGRGFYGAVKVHNLTQTFSGGNFQSASAYLYYAIYSPYYLTFSDIQVSPTLIRGGDNVTITWTSSQPATTVLKYYYTDINGVASNIATYSNSSLVSSHSAVIDGSTVTFPNVYYFWVTGVAADNSGYSSTTKTFSVNNPASESKYAPFAGATSVVLFTYNKKGFAIAADCSLEMVSLDVVHNQTYRGMSPYIPTNYYNIQVANVTGGFKTVWAAVYDYDSVMSTNPTLSGSYGNHNVSCTSDGYTQINTSINIPVSSPPVFYDIYFDAQPKCYAQLFGMSTVQECEVNSKTFNLPWYCQFDTSYCIVKDTNTGICKQYGAYTGYICDTQAAIPSGYPVNGTVGIGTPANGTSYIVPALTDPIAALIGLTGAQVLNMIALMITIGVSVFAGIKAKDGLVAIISFVGLLVLFTLIGWLPFWIMVVLMLISAFIGATFARKIFMGSG